MKKKTAIVSVLLGILVIGIVSAGFLNFFGKITGSVVVEGPVFYLDGYWGGVYYNLFTNEIPEDEEEVYLYDGNRLLFITEPLGVDNFYQANFDIHIWAKTNNSGNLLQFQVVRIKPELEEEVICVPPAIEPSSSGFYRKETSCSSPDTISLNPEDRIGLIIMGAGIDSEYWIRPGHKYTQDGNPAYDRIEVSAT